VESEESRKKVLETVRAIEMHMALSCIAMGIFQSLSICLIRKVGSGQFRYQRTPSKGRVSEADIMYYLRKYFSAPKAGITHNTNNSGAAGRTR
jgi:hypothetical protein